MCVCGWLGLGVCVWVVRVRCVCVGRGVCGGGWVVVI